MPRYIDADVLLKRIIKQAHIVSDNQSRCEGLFLPEIQKNIVKMPSADVQEVVHCKDCKHYTNNINPNFGMRKGYCDRITDYCFYKCKDNDFCSYGAKMDGADNEN